MPIRRLAVRLLRIRCPAIHLQLPDVLIGDDLNFIQLTGLEPEIFLNFILFYFLNCAILKEGKSPIAGKVLPWLLEL